MERSPKERRLDIALAIGATLVVALAGIALAVRISGEGGRLDCDGYEFDQDAWRSGTGSADREAQADALARCGVLLGRSRDYARQLLGVSAERPTPKPNQDWYLVGSVRSGFGIGDDQVLKITYGPNHTVERVVFYDPSRLGPSPRAAEER